MELEQLKGKNWVAAMALCWFLGAFGAHRFYTGKTNSAWVMVVLTLVGLTAPISAIWALVDGFTLAFNKYKAADGGNLFEYINWLGWLYVAAVILGILAFMFYGVMILALLSSAFAGAGTGAY